MGGPPMRPGRNLSGDFQRACADALRGRGTMSVTRAPRARDLGPREGSAMPNLGAPELIIVLAIVVVLFGASRIPEIMGGMGKGIREFRKAAREGEEQRPTPPEGTSPSEGARPPDGERRDAV